MACHRIIAYPAPVPSHISVHIKIPNAFLQSSSIGLLPVTVSRFWLKNPNRNCVRSCVTIKKKDPKSYLLTHNDPQTCPRGKIFAPLYSTLYYLRFDMQHDCLYKMALGPFWATPHWPWPPGVTSKFQMSSSSPYP